ncbi:MAG TPA: hypothetical protein VIR59_09060 [Gaiellaceae bacterium]
MPHCDLLEVAAAGTHGLRPVEELLLGWFSHDERELPGRGTRDPYAILVSEVMLQQTQVFWECL